MGNARNLADNLPLEGSLSGRNLVINGAQNVIQRGNKTGLTAQAYGTDRFSFTISGRDQLVYNLAQNTDVPSGSGFLNSLSFQTTTPESAIEAGEYAFISHQIEAQNLQQLAYGTSGAKKVTVSFWVKSSVTGTFCFGLYKGDNTGQIHNKTYTINSASTWEKKTITFEANTLSGGAIDDDNGLGLYMTWHLAAGSSYDSVSTTSGWSNYSTTKWCEPNTTDAVLTTTNATFYLTGVQLEVGSKATAFEHEPFGITLAKCQRYFFSWTSSGLSDNLYLSTPYASGTPPNTSASVAYTFPVTMRTAPTMSALTGSAVSNLNRFTSSVHNATAQHASTAPNGAYSLETWTADAELL